MLWHYTEVRTRKDKRSKQMKKIILSLILITGLLAFLPQSIEAAPAINQVEDAVAASGDSGPAVLTVRRDTAATSAGASGDYATLNTDATGNLYTTAVFTTGATSLTKDEDVAETDGADGVLFLGVRRDVQASSAGTTGDYATLNLNATGALYTTGGSNDTFGTTTYTETTNTGPTVGAVRNDTLATLVNTDNEIAPLQVDADGALYTVDRSNAVLGTATYTETTTIGSVIGAVRNDTLATLANTDNEIAPLQVDALGALFQIGREVAVLGTDTYTETTSLGSLIGAVRTDTEAALANTTNEVTPLQTDSTGNLRVRSRPWSAILETGIFELIGINEQVDQNNYGDEIGVALAATHSGTITGITLVSTEDGSGAVMNPVGVLHIFDADPVITVNDAALAAASHPFAIAEINVAAADWIEDTGGAHVSLSLPNSGIPFHALGTVYFSFQTTDATSINSAAGDDEQIEAN